MNSNTITEPEFQTGDNVVLAGGPYQGTSGMFLHLTEEDVNWAEIEERNGPARTARHHPVIWLKHADD
jgi:putative AlgH/UPF0301 family transcriptional regulator